MERTISVRFIVLTRMVDLTRIFTDDNGVESQQMAPLLTFLWWPTENLAKVGLNDGSNDWIPEAHYSKVILLKLNFYLQ